MNWNHRIRNKNITKPYLRKEILIKLIFSQKSIQIHKVVKHVWMCEIINAGWSGLYYFLSDTLAHAHFSSLNGKWDAELKLLFLPEHLSPRKEKQTNKQTARRRNTKTLGLHFIPQNYILVLFQSACRGPSLGPLISNAFMHEEFSFLSKTSRLTERNKQHEGGRRRQLPESLCKTTKHAEPKTSHSCV